MANTEHLKILKQGIEAWNRWRRGSPLIEPDLRGISMIGEDLTGINFSSTNLMRAALIDTSLCRSSLVKANLQDTNLRSANLQEVDLSYAKLSGSDLRDANLKYADLNNADLHEAYLHAVDFSEANLYNTDFHGSDLSRANFDKADLTKALLASTNLCNANLNAVILHEVDLSGAIFERTNLTGTDFTNSTIGYTNFADCDLSESKGLDSASHFGPSTVGIDTLYRSKGKIPEAFLRSCGISDVFIDYIPSLIGALQPVQFYSCFISYSTKDEDFARRLHSRMRDNHLRVWFADEDMKSGQKIHEQIDQAIRIHDKLVLVLSDQSIQSEWVMTEIRKARKAELKTGRRKLFPLRLVDMDTLRQWECFDADTGKDLAVEVREYFIPDFSHWKDHDAFERAFARFLKDLQATEAPPIPRETPKVSDEAKTDAQQSVIEIKKRRLRLLEEQQARKGHNTEPHILMEIEDLRRELEQ